MVPLTTNTTRILPFQVLLRAAECGLPVDSKAQAEQVRSVTTGRIRERICRLSPDSLGRLDNALRLHLSL
ncbi:hypothetical protein Misp02_19840 [Microtetraspora sp. NBRC 16547]|nr:hypothetical protein Misp02_19840 [Microtetraspora sp. NBRC 16547]